MEANPLPQLIAMMAIATPGVSETAKTLEKSLQEPTIARTAHSISLAGRASQVESELRELWEECREADWDGYGASKLNVEACRRTLQLFQALPARLPLPEVSAMPNGDVALDWDFAARRTLTVTVSDRTRLVYAAIDGDEEWSGTVSFQREFPSSISKAIGRVARLA